MFYIPTRGPEDWKQLLAEPEKHWKTGYSARALAYCWESAQGFPPEVEAALKFEPVFADIEPLLCLPEHRVPLPGGQRPSQNDLWVLAKCSSGLVSIAVEGKVAEPFGETIGEWLRNASPGKQERLRYLADCLGLTLPLPEGIRYQLLHRTASAIIEARRFNAAYAVMLVHSFSQKNMWLEDYHAFVSLLVGGYGDKSLTSLTLGDGITLSINWVIGNTQWLVA